mmetsp:Transcript_74629/g.136267  ORF Transcript_74629/g.136267 Transcript_74629/m.136267 type:complete len:242 (-) Transcript_74629:21-746(-)
MASRRAGTACGSGLSSNAEHGGKLGRGISADASGVSRALCQWQSATPEPHGDILWTRRHDGRDAAWACWGTPLRLRSSKCLRLPRTAGGSCRPWASRRWSQRVWRRCRGCRRPRSLSSSTAARWLGPALLISRSAARSAQWPLTSCHHSAGTAASCSAADDSDAPGSSSEAGELPRHASALAVADARANERGWSSSALADGSISRVRSGVPWPECLQWPAVLGNGHGWSCVTRLFRMQLFN